MLSKHPCFNADAHHIYGRMHLPVAPDCNVQCNFCNRKFSCLNESRPGVSAAVISPEEAVKKACSMAEKHPELSVVGIAGPGDPLANPLTTLPTLRMIREQLPNMILCLSTNGLALPDYAEALAELGVLHITVTVNAVYPATGARVYRFIRPDGEKLTGEDAAQILLERQERGIRMMKKFGATVKVNTVIIPGVNDEELPRIAEKVKSWGADVLNCMPLIPVEGTPFAQCPPLPCDRVEELRHKAEQYLPQMRHCMRCRADACGLIGSPGILG